MPRLLSLVPMVATSMRTRMAATDFPARAIGFGLELATVAATPFAASFIHAELVAGSAWDWRGRVTTAALMTLIYLCARVTEGHVGAPFPVLHPRRLARVLGAWHWAVATFLVAAAHEHLVTVPLVYGTGLGALLLVQGLVNALEKRTRKAQTTRVRDPDHDASAPPVRPALSAIPLGAFDQAAKRAFDIVFAAAALVLLAPLLGLVALAIKLDSPGPVIFKQRRGGLAGEAFWIYKFRSMTTLEDGDIVQQARRDDPRVTKVGVWLRRLNLDELPQLLNVLRGEMSIVGPRPHALAHDRAFCLALPEYARRRCIKPGITGWAQVSGHRGGTETEARIRDRVEHDLFYIDNWSFSFDLVIIFMTVLSPRARRNAY